MECDVQRASPQGLKILKAPQQKTLEKEDLKIKWIFFSDGEHFSSFFLQLFWLFESNKWKQMNSLRGSGSSGACSAISKHQSVKSKKKCFKADQQREALQPQARSLLTIFRLITADSLINPALQTHSAFFTASFQNSLTQ